MQLDIIIFSKNRACQLHSLLRSIKDNLQIGYYSCYILYKFTDELSEQCYHHLRNQEIINNITWVPEINFREDLIKLLLQLQRKDNDSLIMFLVDDNVIFRKFQEKYILGIFTDDHCFISTRLSRNHDYLPPIFIKQEQYLEWYWDIDLSKWNYPFSVDGNIHRTRVINQHIIKLNFKAPNSLESALTFYFKESPELFPKGLAPLEEKVFNNPLNKVQTEGHTWHGRSMTVDDLNKAYLKGYIINNNILYKSMPTNCHFLVENNLLIKK